MANVSAPYNFVPLNEKVFLPPWANLVNHDVPFKNGLSGQIELEITAKTPVFIRKPYEKGDDYYTSKDKTKIAKEFCHIKNKNGDKRYYIPGSSIRNMLRAVVEIMGFGKLDTYNKTEKFSFRDMANSNLYTLSGFNRLQFGWLIKEDFELRILSCGNLGSLWKGGNTNTFFRGKNYNDRNLDYFEDFTTEEFKTFIDEETNIETKYKLFNKRFYSASDFDKSKEDYIEVLTGNITGKLNEFYFKTPKNIDSSNTLNLEQSIFNAFEKINQNDENWKFWKKLFQNGKYVPVFFRKENDKIIDFGLTVLYKMMHKNALEDVVNKQQPENNDKKSDLAEIIFGTIENKKLKGRVQISHAFSSNANPKKTEVKLILGEPKNTFYPFYIKQNVNNNTNLISTYNTLSNDIENSEEQPKISGRKRYPIHSKFNSNPFDINPDARQNTNRDIETQIFPIKENAVFKTTINYHNLLPNELGALLSAISFHKAVNAKHNIGLAKAYGYGRINIKITNKKDDWVDKYLSYYESVITKFTKNKMGIDWINTIQIKELIAMATLNQNQDRKKLKYLKLADFQNIKNKKNPPKALPLYSKFMDINTIVKSRIKPEFTSEMNALSLEIVEDYFKNKKTELFKEIKSKLNAINNLINT